jgi:hypothetical protein
VGECGFDVESEGDEGDRRSAKGREVSAVGVLPIRVTWILRREVNTRQHHSLASLYDK